MAGNDSFTLSVAGRARSKVSPFYNPTLDNLSKEARDLFENYSGIDPDRVVSHVEEIVRRPSHSLLLNANSSSEIEHGQLYQPHYPSTNIPLTPSPTSFRTHALAYSASSTSAYAPHPSTPASSRASKTTSKPSSTSAAVSGPRSDSSSLMAPRARIYMARTCGPSFGSWDTSCFATRAVSKPLF